MRLARDFGRPDVDRFLAGLTAAQLMEWLAFTLIEQQQEQAAILDARVKGRQGRHQKG